MATGSGIGSMEIAPVAPSVPSAPPIPTGVPTPGIASEMGAAAKAISAEAPTAPTIPGGQSAEQAASENQDVAKHITDNLPAEGANVLPGAQAEVVANAPVSVQPPTEAGLPAGQATNPDVAVGAAPNPGTTEPANAPTETQAEEVKAEEAKPAETKEAVDANMQRILAIRDQINGIDEQLRGTTDLDLARQLHWQKQGLENDLRIEQAHYAKERLKQQMETASKEGAKSQIAQDVEARVSRDYSTLPEAVTSQIAPLIAEAMQALLNDLSKNQETTLEQELPDQRAESVTAMDLVKAVIKFFLKLVIQAMIDQEILAAEKQRAQQQAQPGATTQPSPEPGGATQAEQGVIPPPTPTTSETPVAPAAPVAPVVNAPAVPAAPVVAPAGRIAA